MAATEEALRNTGIAEISVVPDSAETIPGIHHSTEQQAVNLHENGNV